MMKAPHPAFGHLLPADAGRRGTLFPLAPRSGERVREAGVRGRPLLLPLLLLALFSCRGGSIDAPSRETPVVLISIDTLRSDHLPAYGYKGVETPNIDALRADSILYRRAWSHVPLTLPSHASILTGMLPADHGVHDNVGFSVSGKTPMIQELLKKNGYVTGAAVSAFILRRETDINRGFDFFDDDVEPLGPDKLIGRVQRDGHVTEHVLQQWLDSRTDKPFFAFLHLYEPHTPYTPPEPFFSRYPDHYDGEIATADAIVGTFLDFLKQKGVYDKALIILLSDHGEGLNEHGEEEHGVFLYREALQVPLMVKLPGAKKKGTTVETPVELVDVFPTILERTATPAPAGGSRPGQSLLTFLNGGPTRPIYAETYYARFHFGWSDLHSLIDGNDHYIRAPQPELYDLGKDPGEKHNEIEENRRAYARLRDAIEPYVRQTPAPASIDSEEAAKLAALGYIGSTAAIKPGADLPDPKTMAGVFRDIRTAFTSFEDGKYDESLRLTDQLLATNSQITDLWDMKYQILFKMNRKAEALATAKEALRRVPTSVQLLYDVANGAMAVGDLDTAKQHAELAEKIEPGEAHDILSRIWALRGDDAKAIAEAKLAIETEHNPTNALMLLANAEKLHGNLDGALAYLNRASDYTRRSGLPQPGLHLQRGDVLARLGRPGDAESEFRAEIAQFPAVPNAYASLMMLLATEHRADEATKVVYDCVKASPQPHTYVVIAEAVKAIGDDRGALYWASQGLQRYPNDAELRRLPERLRTATRMLQKNAGTQ